MNVPEIERNIKPGWAIRFPDGEWLCYAHGWFTSKDPFYARRETTEESATANLIDCKEEGYEGGEVVVAWEPYCAHLLFDIDELKKANKISPRDLFDIAFELDMIIGKLRGSNE